MTHHRPFHRFLEGTVDPNEGEFDEIPDVLNRYKTLHDANLDLKEVVESRESENDKLRAELNQLQRETQNAVLVNNSEIHGHQKQLENLRVQARPPPRSPPPPPPPPPLTRAGGIAVSQSASYSVFVEFELY